MSFQSLPNAPPAVHGTRGPAPLRALPSKARTGRPAAKCILTLTPSVQHCSGASSSCAVGAPWKSHQPSVLCQGTPGLMNLPLDRDLDQQLDGFDSIRSALDDLAAGKFVVVLDDENRENEGDLIIAADKVTTEAMHYMVEHTSGVICISMGGRDLDCLRLPLMVSSAENEEAMYTAFTVTVDLKEGITTGISASDRAKTIRRLADPTATAADFRRPGHIFPLRYHAGGVLVRPGHTEAGVDLARLAGCYPAGVLCEIVDRRDGSMSRTPQLLEFVKQHNLKCITIADLIRYRLRHERLVVRTATAHVQSPAYGPLTVHTYRCALDDSEHLAVVVGDAAHAHGAVPVHVHRESHIGDLLVDGPGAMLNGSGGGGLHGALKAMAAHGQGVVVYMRPRLEGRPSLAAELKALDKESGQASVAGARREPRASLDIRLYGLAAQMLRDVGVSAVTVTGDGAEQAAVALTSCGLNVQPHQPAAQQHNGNGNGAVAASLAGAR